MIIDSHVHIWLKTITRYPADLSFGPLPNQRADPGFLLNTMSKAGVNKAILVQPGNYGFDASLIADNIAEYPERFSGIGMVNPALPSVCEALDYWVNHRGLIGMRVLMSMIDDEYFDNLWKKTYQLGAILSFLTGPADLSPLRIKLRKNCETRVVLDHFAHRRLNDDEHLNQLIALAKFPNVFVKVSGLYALSATPHPHPDSIDAIEKVFESFGSDRLLWGSDFPYIIDTCGYQACCDFFLNELVFIPREDREKICGENARRFWKLMT